MAAHLLAIDQGTSATKCVLVDANGRIVAKFSASLDEQLPHPGWVEQNAEHIWQSVRAAVAGCLAQQAALNIVGVGISTQRESALIWQRNTGEAISPLLSWQDQRTLALSAELLRQHPQAGQMVREKSGLPLDPMFSALKINWLLDSLDPHREQAKSGKWCAGTVDAFLLARLGGDFVSEIGNASRTQLLNVHQADWDDDLLRLFNIPKILLPRISASRGHFALADNLHDSLKGVPVLSVMADSHSALFAHGAYEAGQVKATLGTGSSVMALAPLGGQQEHPGLCRTIAWDIGNGPMHALEGNIRAAGSTLRWLADLFEMPTDAAAQLASTSESDNVFIIPGFNGLGAPWWDTNAQGLISGLTFSTDKKNILAAGLESIAHQVADVLDALDQSVAGINQLYLDGGPSRNERLVALLSTYIRRPVVQCPDPELSALGVAHLAGLQANIWDIAALKNLERAQKEVFVEDENQRANQQRKCWLLAVKRARLL